MDEEKKVNLIDDGKDIKQAVDGTVRAVNKFFTHGTAQIIGPATTKVLTDSRKLINWVSDKLTKRDGR